MSALTIPAPLAPLPPTLEAVAPSEQEPVPPTVTPTRRRGIARVLEPVPFILAHLTVLGALWSGSTTTAWVLFAVLWFVRMFFITAGFHRYFSHRSYQTSRVFQFVLAFMAQSSGQRGILWWAAHHRAHHKYSDGPDDPHSPRQGFWHAHLGWLYAPGADDTRWASVRDLSKYPELRFLNRFWWLPSTSLGVLVLAIFGAPGLFIGFFGSTILLWHTTFIVNSLAHVIGSRRYDTNDDSRNNLGVALLTLGEGWHNNHHYDMNAVRQGRRWYEIDITWYILVVMSWTGLVWNLRPPREAVARREARAALRLAMKPARATAPDA